jgi:NAD(P)-dependent dehydrogenase (short-subunit alcohol dehydrogenase family)
MANRTPFPGLGLVGSVAFVTGGGSGIGLETVLTFAELGADVAIFDIAEGASAAAAKRVKAAGRRAVAIQGDAASEEDVARAFEQTHSELGDVDIAVACAGILGDWQQIDATSVEHFDRVMAVNVRGSFLVIRAAVPQMRRRGHGAIIVLSSLDGLQAETGMASYCTSKGALLNLARAAALDLARENIRVNAVCPSVTLTPLLEGRLATMPDGDARRLRPSIRWVAFSLRATSPPRSRSSSRRWRPGSRAPQSPSTRARARPGTTTPPPRG